MILVRCIRSAFASIARSGWRRRSPALAITLRNGRGRQHRRGQAPRINPEAPIEFKRSRHLLSTVSSWTFAIPRMSPEVAFAP